jgi:hypothetical protein
MWPRSPRFLVLMFAGALFCPLLLPAQQGTSEAFELRGIVVNASTGQPISGALVEMLGVNGVEFSGSDEICLLECAKGRILPNREKAGLFSGKGPSHGRRLERVLVGKGPLYTVTRRK